MCVAKCASKGESSLIRVSSITYWSEPSRSEGVSIPKQEYSNLKLVLFFFVRDSLIGECCFTTISRNESEKLILSTFFFFIGSQFSIAWYKEGLLQYIIELTGLNTRAMRNSRVKDAKRNGVVRLVDPIVRHELYALRAVSRFYNFNISVDIVILSLHYFLSYIIPAQHYITIPFTSLLFFN